MVLVSPGVLSAGHRESKGAAAAHTHLALETHTSPPPTITSVPVINQAVADVLDHHRHVVLLDLHSFGPPLGVDVVLGDAGATTASAQASERVERALRDEGLTVARNLRFTGGHIVRRWAQDRRVDAVQLELNQRRYLDTADVDAARPRPRRDPAAWADTRQVLSRAIQSLTVLGR